MQWLVDNVCAIREAATVNVRNLVEKFNPARLVLYNAEKAYTQNNALKISVTEVVRLVERLGVELKFTHADIIDHKWKA